MDGNELATSLEVGNNFAINAEEGNSEGQELWVVCCTKPLHMLTSPLKCNWGMKYNVGDKIVAWKHYKRMGEL